MLEYIVIRYVMVVSILSNDLILKCSPPVRQFNCVLTWPVVRMRHDLNTETKSGFCLVGKR